MSYMIRHATVGDAEAMWRIMSDDNERAIGLYRKLDFQPEGTMRGDALRRGVLADAYAMARLRERPRLAT